MTPFLLFTMTFIVGIFYNGTNDFPNPRVGFLNDLAKDNLVFGVRKVSFCPETEPISPIVRVP